MRTDVVEYGGVTWVAFPEQLPGQVLFVGDQAMNENQAEAKSELWHDPNQKKETGPGVDPGAKSEGVGNDNAGSGRARDAAPRPFPEGAGLVPDDTAKPEPAEPLSVSEAKGRHGPGKMLPRYECHKRVWGLKIKDVWVESRSTSLLTAAEVAAPPRGQLQFCEPGHAPRTMSGGWMEKHQPKAGGYWVLYEDGSESFSPGEAFENGYTLMQSSGGPDRKCVIRDGKPTGELVALRQHTAAPVTNY